MNDFDFKPMNPMSGANLLRLSNTREVLDFVTHGANLTQLQAATSTLQIATVQGKPDAPKTK